VEERDMILNPPPKRKQVEAHWTLIDCYGEPVWLEVNTLELQYTDNRPEQKLVPAPSLPVPRIRPPIMMVLIPTFACNLRCRYCFVPDDMEADFMALDTAIEAIERFRTVETVGFFGGEPLKHWSLIEQVTAYLRGREKCGGKRRSLHVTTNGTMIGEAHAMFLARHRYSLIVSIDGPPDIHDAERIQPNGKGSHELVLRGLQRLAAAGCKQTTLRGTFTPRTLRLVERVDYLNSLLRQGLGQAVSVEPASLGDNPYVGRFEEDDFERLADEYHALAEWMVDEYLAGRIPRHMQLERTIRRLLDRQLSTSQCGAGNGYITIGPTGTIYACHRARHEIIIGSVAGGFTEDRAKWIDNRFTNSLQCQRCDLRFVCGGVCRLDGIQETGHMWRPSKANCAIKRMWVKEACWIILQAHRKGFFDRLYHHADIKYAPASRRRPST